MASLFFYAWFNVYYLPILLASILINYGFGVTLSKDLPKHPKFTKKTILTVGVLFNIILLGYYKYTDFLIENFNALTGSDVPLTHILLPLALSFVTFQKIAYLVDSYNGKTKEYDLLTFSLFASFFPQQIAGPIVHHAEMMPQFASRWNMFKRYNNILFGLYIFSIGLFKKVIIADTFAVWADEGFAHTGSFEFYLAWITSLSYTFQLYFDFSGYTDMAIGSALLFNIRLPINFNSPYKAFDIQDFWRRWHMTLSRFLRDYVYIPFGGNRKGEFRTYLNLFLTFLIGGIWHGASWMFVAWGALHGAALVIHRAWSKFGFKIPKPIAWFITFNFVNIAWVFFRAPEWSVAKSILSGMTDFQGALTNDVYAASTAGLSKFGFMADYVTSILSAQSAVYLTQLLAIVAALAICSMKNTSQIYLDSKPVEWRHVTVAGIAAGMAVISSLTTTSAVFLYFNF
ncbi:MBOAT family protein [Pseudomonas sp. p1(2021b)]|uniref:MBOAT family O-acyltransferase n=1 Tax=Pseudomonas sp. p1(2021b) TaxID=2874628 RepID=UPI001CCCE743|nr:MBOAT family protein [Pseudomonas sp. p1(2021b)]UBM26571.1 MBOAT family protein [Pseudomonas sp. p1(2021b)]